MSLELDKEITIAPPAKVVKKQWAGLVVMRSNPTLTGSVAEAELIPMTADGELVPRDADGNSLIEKVKCPDIGAYLASGNCPTVAVVMENLVQAISEIKAETARLKALEEAEGE